MITLEATLASQKVILEQLLQKSNDTTQDSNNWKQEGQDIRTEIISLKGLLLSS